MFSSCLSRRSRTAISPTCPYPNPEIRQAFELALKAAETHEADILLATDPDCDRVGIAVNNKNGGYELMSGNEVGVMLLDYLLSKSSAAASFQQTRLPQNPLFPPTLRRRSPKNTAAPLKMCSPASSISASL